MDGTLRWVHVTMDDPVDGPVGGPVGTDPVGDLVGTDPVGDPVGTDPVGGPVGGTDPVDDLVDGNASHCPSFAQSFGYGTTKIGQLLVIVFVFMF